MQQPLITLQLNNIPLSPNNSVKYLNKCYIEYIEQKISNAVGIFAELNSFLHKQTLLKLYYAIVHSHLLNGLAIWGSKVPSYLRKPA